MLTCTKSYVCRQQGASNGLLGGKPLLPVCMMDAVNRLAPQGRRLGPAVGSKPTMAQVLHAYGAASALFWKYPVQPVYACCLPPSKQPGASSSRHLGLQMHCSATNLCSAGVLVLAAGFGRNLIPNTRVQSTAELNPAWCRR